MKNATGIASGLAAAFACAAWGQGPYQLERIGLYGPEFTAANGTWVVTPTRLSLSGVVAGTATRYQGGTATLGAAVWRHDAGASGRIGYTDTAHTTPEGIQTSAIAAINPGGVIIGRSTRSNPPGQTAWLHDGALHRLGYYDLDHTSVTGGNFSTAVALNTAAQCIGYSVRYLETGQSVVDGWLATIGTIEPLGLTDPEHTLPEGVGNSEPRFINDAGDVAGTSRRYGPGGTSLGMTAWVRHAGVYTPCALTDAHHTGPQGERTSTVVGLAASGHVTGFSYRYNAPPFVTETAWLASPGVPAVAIGLSDPPHIGAIGQQLGGSIAVTASGMVIGRSVRYQGNGGNGESAWLHRDGVTTRIGLFGPGYATPTGFEYAVAREINDLGAVLGASTRVAGGTAIWVHSARVTRRVGLFDARHTDQNGNQHSMSLALNARGDAIGTSNRHSPPFASTMGWYYDAATGVVHELVFSQTSIGLARTDPSVLLDSGVVLGSYDKYSGDTYIGNYAFRWSVSEGLTELHQLVAGGLSAPWTRLHIVSGMSIPGSWDESSIVGLGRRTGETSSSATLLRALAACDPDFNCDGNVDQDDVGCMINAVAGNPGCECQDPDFNRDGNVDHEDVAAIINVVAGGACP